MVSGLVVGLCPSQLIKHEMALIAAHHNAGVILVICCWLKCCFTSTETVGLLGTGAQDVHLDFHTPPEL